MPRRFIGKTLVQKLGKHVIAPIHDYECLGGTYLGGGGLG